MSEHDNDRKALDAIAVAIGPRESGSTSGKDVESASKSEEAERESPLKTKKALWAWLLLCYSVRTPFALSQLHILDNVLRFRCSELEY
jgi:hypothetical protein